MLRRQGRGGGGEERSIKYVVHAAKFHSFAVTPALEYPSGFLSVCPSIRLSVHNLSRPSNQPQYDDLFPETTVSTNLEFHV